MKIAPKHRSTLALAIFASALLMLAVNDGLLKGQGVVPTWLSGKLSDFTGLIVAPVTLVLLAGARRRRTQLCCLLAVAGLFTLTEVSPASAELAQALAARLGLSWRLWPDPSDLAALSVLPISWFCCRALSCASATQSARARVTRWLRLPAIVACLASSGVDTFSARGYVYNATDATVFVEVSSTWLDCADFSAFGRAFLQPEDFVSLGLFELGAGAVLPLEPGSLGDPSELDSASLDCMCPAVRVSTGGRTVNVRLESLPRVELVQKPSGGQLVRARAQLLVLHAEPEPIEVGALLGTFELEQPGAHPSAACAVPDLAALDVAVPSALGTESVPLGSESLLRDLTIMAREPVAGNCFEVELDTALSRAMPAVDGGAPVDTPGTPADAGLDAATTVQTTTPPERLGHTRIQICAPFEMFPFQAGERVDLRWSDLSREPPYVEYLEIHNEQAAFKLMRGLFFAPRYSWQSPGAWEGYDVTLPAARCGPLRDAEGASFEAIDVTHAGQALVPGRAVRINRHEEVYLGRARRHLGRGCGADQSWLEVVERWTQ